MPTESQRPAILSSGTLVPLGAALVLAGVFFKGYQSIMDTVGAQRDAIMGAIGTQRDDIRDVKEDVRSLRSEVGTRTADRWTKTDMKVWTLQLQQALQASGSSARIPTPD